MSMPKGHRPGKYKARVIRESFTPDELDWIRRIVTASPMSNDEAKVTLSEAACLIKAQIKNMSERSSSLTVEEHKIAGSLGKRLIELYKSLGIDDKRPDDGTDVL